MDVLTSYLQVPYKLRLITEKDALLQTVKKFIKSCWPFLRQHAEWSQPEGFYRRRESLTIEQGCVLFRERVIIPTTLRTKSSNSFTMGIQGSNGWSLARNYAYCPGMDRDIEEMVRVCGPCAGAHPHRLCWSATGEALPRRRGRLLKVPEVISAPKRHPGRQWQYSVNCAPNMGFQRQSSVITGRSLPHSSSGSSARLMLSVTFCHHRTTPIKWSDRTFHRHLQAWPPQIERGGKCG